MPKPLLFVITFSHIGLSFVRKELPKSYGERTKDMEKVRHIFENSSFADFLQNMEYKLRNIHLADSPEQIDFYTECSMKEIMPGYRDVISCDMVNLHFLEGKEENDTYYIKSRATARLIRCDGGKVRIQHELIDFAVTGKKKVIDQPIRAICEYKCPNCANSLNLFKGVTCGYCGAALDYADYDWMINEYSGKRMRCSLPVVIKWIICVILIVTAVASVVL